MLQSFDITPLQLAAILRTKEGFVWLDSLEPHAGNTPKEQGLSLLAAEPDLILEGGPADWSLLEEEVARRAPHQEKNPLTSTSSLNFNCCGAAIGFFRYDGSFRFGFYKTVYRHHSSSTTSQWLSPPPVVELKSLPERAQTSNRKLDFKCDLKPSGYIAMVKQAQEEIAAGNIYQVCLAHRFQAACDHDPWPFYLSLRRHSPAPFAAYLNLGEETILSSSPECFLKIDGRHILTRPIKGTRPRGSTPQEDAQQAIALKTSSKENAELVMITDLERNDLGKVCDYESVTTSQLLHLEPYPQVFHLVSTIEGKLRTEVSHVKAVAACFPGGSISGAPKKRALEIIEQLEPAPRGLFTGAIGYFGFDGKSQFNIAIRTVVINAGCATFHVGAGITSDSIPEQEWEETLHKAAGILAASQ